MRITPDNLKEALSHFDEMAKEHRRAARHMINDTDCQKCLDRAEDYEQLVAWLEELEQRREADTWHVINTAEDLPKERGAYLVTFLADSAEGEYETVDRTWFTPECGFMRELSKKVIAWKPSPAAYKRNEEQSDE